MLRWLLPLLLLIACAKNPAPTGPAQFQLDLHGEFPTEVIGLPAFTATNSDGTPRGPDDLRGMSTVMWFFPAAFTSG